MPKSLVTRASGFRKILIVSCKYTLTASIGTVCLIDEKIALKMGCFKIKLSHLITLSIILFIISLHFYQNRSNSIFIYYIRVDTIM